MRITQPFTRAGRGVTTATALVTATAAMLAGAALLGASSANAVACADAGQALAYANAVDFDGDNIADAAYGEPSWNAGGEADAGTVRIVQSCASSFYLTGAALGFGPSVSARWGATVNALDFNSDYYTDLVVSAPGQNKVGVVVIVFGSEFGLGNGLPAKRITVSSLEAGDRFGASVLVTTTDADGDGPTAPRRHVVIGAPGVDVGARNAGAVFDATFTVGGTSVRTLARWVQGYRGVPGSAEKGDQFGESLSAGTYWDGTSVPVPTVAVGVPHENVGKAVDAGTVVVMQGAGFDRARSVSRATAGVPGVPRAGDRFGHAVLGHTSVVYVGIPGDDVGGARDAGSVQRLTFRTGGGIRVSASRSQHSKGVAGSSERGDRLGSSLAWVSTPEAGPSLAAGAPYEDVDGRKDAGAVTYLSFSGYCADGCATVTQNSGGAPGTAESGDRFGATLTTVGNEVVDPEYRSYGLLIGVPGEDVGDLRDAGALAGRTSYSPLDAGTAPGERLGEVAPAVLMR